MNDREKKDNRQNVTEDRETSGPTDELPADGISAHARAFYTYSMRILQEAGVPFLIGGAYAFAQYTGIVRHTKDFDLFVVEQDCKRALDALSAAGYKTETPFPHWLAKAYDGADFVDIIFNSGNGLAVVDQLWFDNAQERTVLGMPVRLCPPEEMIWSKAFVQERERYDGADVAHLIKACGATLDWDRLASRFGRHWRVLLAHLVLFGFIYPAERGIVPGRVMSQLTERLERETRSPAPLTRVCQGPLISREQYLIDIDAWGYTDARLEPRGNLSAEDTAAWTASITTGK